MIARLLTWLRARLDAHIDAKAKAALAAYGAGNEQQAQILISQVRRAQFHRAVLCCNRNCDGRQCPSRASSQSTTT